MVSNFIIFVACILIEVSLSSVCVFLFNKEKNENLESRYSTDIENVQQVTYEEYEEATP